MKNRSYRLTRKLKILITKISICIFGTFCGYALEIYNENNKWDNLIYPGAKIAELDVGGKTKEEAIKLIKSHYIDVLVNEEIEIKANDNKYTINKGRIIKEYDLNTSVNNAFDYGKDMDFYKKHKLIKQGVSKKYNVNFILNEEYIKNFLVNLEKEIDKSPVGAAIIKEKGQWDKVWKDENGVKLQSEKLEKYIKEAVYNGNKYIEAPVQEEVSSITLEEINSINTKISSFSTSLVASSIERLKNVEVATSFVNGKLLMPDEVFSFNETVGERTKARGFEEAPIIVGNTVDNGLGGGICQVSSTLYNALLKAGIKPVERVKHSIPVNYVPFGLDATVVWGQIDFKFRNTLQYPMYIEAYIENNELKVNIYSNGSLLYRSYGINRSLYGSIQGSLQRINIDESNAFKLKKLYDGYVVRVTMDYYENGNLIGSNLISEDYYGWNYIIK
ncbi:VanW family protein [Desnuesiella massiliensis]|uniref:VanW family protein n=1 Tax=Desnuesiella massiliensis TaxID=1650662 RepID=UPI0006E2229B|nr:VanW family protein [Desnuesiella massiliensis]